MTPIEFITAVKNASTDDDSKFRELFPIGFALTGLAAIDFAEQLGVSTPTVERYITGKSLPHPALRSTVYRLLANAVMKRNMNGSRH